MATLQPYLHFTGQAKDALAFYNSIFGGTLDVILIGNSPIGPTMPANVQNHILHGQLKSGAISLVASDMTEMNSEHVAGHSISLMLDCKSKEEITSLYDQLKVDGHIHDPLQEQFWGATFGVLRDKFGITWMLNYQHPTQ